jgi:hypothetical protein
MCGTATIVPSPQEPSIQVERLLVLIGNLGGEAGHTRFENDFLRRSLQRTSGVHWKVSTYTSGRHLPVTIDVIYLTYGSASSQIAETCRYFSLGTSESFRRGSDSVLV